MSKHLSCLVNRFHHSYVTLFINIAPCTYFLLSKRVSLSTQKLSQMLAASSVLCNGSDSIVLQTICSKKMTFISVADFLFFFLGRRTVVLFVLTLDKKAKQDEEKLMLIKLHLSLYTWFLAPIVNKTFFSTFLSARRVKNVFVTENHLC